MYMYFNTIEEALEEIRNSYSTYEPENSLDRKGCPEPTYERFLSSDKKWFCQISIIFPTIQMRKAAAKYKQHGKQFSIQYDRTYLVKLECSPVSNVRFLFRSKIRKFKK